jgi:hypothetical protein
MMGREAAVGLVLQGIWKPTKKTTGNTSFGRRPGEPFVTT